MNEYTFESPVDLVKHLYAGENTPTGICRAPSALFVWYSRAKRVYDTSLCSTCKQNIKEEDVENEYIYSETPNFENEAMICYANNERKRNSEALIQKTFRNGRTSRVKQSCCFKVGTWFCYYK
jgi:hypothetical protein